MGTETTGLAPAGGGPAGAPFRAAVLLAASGIEKSCRRGLWPSRHRRPVRGVDLALFPAEVAGLVGENGSGKSTLMKILVGALAPDAGTVSVAGRLGYCPQEPQVYERLTCDEHFELFGHAYALSSADQLAGRRGPLRRSGSGSMRPPAPTSCPAGRWPS